VKGFMKGTVKGIGGVFLKPLSGGLDLLKKTSEGAHNMIKIGGKSSKKGQIVPVINNY
jgi:hypothetical protein